MPRRWPKSAFTIDETAIAVPFPWVSEAALVEPSGTVHILAGPPSDRGSCGFSAGAALAPDGRRALYVVARTTGDGVVRRDGVPLSGNDEVAPSLRLIDLATDVDTLVADGACAPAWAADGRIAYVQGAVAGWSPGRGPRSGTIVVRATPGSRPAVWSSEAAGYQDLRFVGGGILATRLDPDMSALVLFGRPGAARVVGRKMQLIAVAPSGSRALVTTIPDLYGSERATVRLLRLPDGGELSSLRLDPEAENLAPGGSWQGVRVVTSVGFFPGGTTHPRPALFILDTTGDRLRIEEEFGFASRLVGPGPFADFQQPSFVDSSHVAGLFGYFGERYLSCDLVAHVCAAWRLQAKDRQATLLR